MAAGASPLEQTGVGQDAEMVGDRRPTIVAFAAASLLVSILLTRPLNRVATADRAVTVA